MNEKILIIDDDRVFLNITKELLEFSGYKVYTAFNGHIGLKIAQEKFPDLIISDIMMPGMDGFQVYNELQKNKSTQKVPFLFMSVRSTPEEIRFGMNTGADDYITKPFTESDLLRAIASRLARHYSLVGSKKKAKKFAFPKMKDLQSLRNYLERNGDLVDIEKNEELFKENRPNSAVYLVVSGLLKTVRLDEYGKELITGFYKRNDFLGFYSFQPGGTYPETAKAMENSCLYKFSSKDFNAILLNSQHLTIEFSQLISDNLLQMKSHLLEMAYSSVLKKTTNTILQFAEKIQGDPQQYIKISRSDLANVAGISTESFIRSLSSLKKEGLIDIVGREIRILNLQKLQKIK